MSEESDAEEGLGQQAETLVEGQRASFQDQTSKNIKWNFEENGLLKKEE